MCEKIICRTCGQPLPPQSREGVWLPPMKAKIFDFIDQHPTITAEGIAAQFDRNIKCIRVHICQINDLLTATNTRIDGGRGGGTGYGARKEYRVIRPRRR